MTHTANRRSEPEDFSLLDAWWRAANYMEFDSIFTEDKPVILPITSRRRNRSCDPHPGPGGPREAAFARSASGASGVDRRSRRGHAGSPRLALGAVKTPSSEPRAASSLRRRSTLGAPRTIEGSEKMNILVATDGSKNAPRAVKYAARLAHLCSEVTGRRGTP